MNGPATSAEVAKRTGTNERYVREWLGGMTTAKYRYIESGFVKETLSPCHRRFNRAGYKGQLLSKLKE